MYRHANKLSSDNQSGDLSHFFHIFHQLRDLLGKFSPSGIKSFRLRLANIALPKSLAYANCDRSETLTYIFAMLVFSCFGYQSIIP